MLSDWKKTMNMPTFPITLSDQTEVKRVEFKDFPVVERYLETSSSQTKREFKQN